MPPVPSTDRLSFEERLARTLSRGWLGFISFRLLKLRGIELPRSVRIGSGLRLAHGAVGLVVHESTVLGDHVQLYQGVTLGRSDTYLPRSGTKSGGGIVVGNEVLIGANAVVLFRSGQELTVGDRAVIGAGAVVLQSVPAGEIWAGSPAKRVGTRAES